MTTTIVAALVAGCVVALLWLLHTPRSVSPPSPPPPPVVYGQSFDPKPLPPAGIPIPHLYSGPRGYQPKQPGNDIIKRGGRVR